MIFVLNMLENIRGLLIDEVEPDEWDLQMIHEAKKENDGVSIYSIDGDFYAGLVNSSYHTAMETLVRRGPQVFTLKRLARAAAMNGESELCRLQDDR